MARFTTSPSRIARYFFHECERQFRFHATPKPARAAEGVPSAPFEYSPVNAAILEGGYAWEEEVVGKLGARAVVAEGGRGSPLRDRIHDKTATHRLLADTRPGRFVYQPTLAVPPSFYAAHGLDPALIEIRDNRPDLVAVQTSDGRRVLSIVDVKASTELKTTHRIQVALYALELDAIVRHLGIDADVDLARGGIWLSGQTEPQWFDLSMVRPHLEKFLGEDLPRILARPASEAAWHLFFRCEWCEFFDHCREEAVRVQDVSLMPYLSPSAKKFLATEAGARTLPELRDFLARPGADEVLARSASLAAGRPRLTAQVESLLTGEVRPLGGGALAMPCGENVRVVLCAQREPVGGRPYLFGLLASARADLREPLALERQPEIFIAARPGDVPANRDRFFARVYELMARVNRYNAGKPEWKDQISLQFYLYDGIEQRVLTDALVEGLATGKPELALALLFHFQDPQLAKADEHPVEAVNFPIVVLTDVIRRLFALPVPVAYRATEALAQLGPRGDKRFRYEPRDYFHFPLSNALRADAIYAAWHKKDERKVESLRREVRQRLYAIDNLIRGIREAAGERLFAWPEKFHLREPWNMRSALLSRLAFISQYESVLGCLETREARTLSREERLLAGSSVPVRAADAESLRITGDLVYDIQESGPPPWLLSLDDARGERDQMSFPDYPYRGKPFGPKREHCVLARIEEVDSDEQGVPRGLTVELKGRLNGGGLRRGERYLLTQRYTDFTSDKVVTFLRELDRDGSRRFLDLIRSPRATEAPLPRGVGSAARRAASGMALTDSQSEAFDRILRQAVTLVWGPPGTGKTHFLASTILALAAAYRSAGREFHVLVTAYTHAAIDNVLRKIAELRPRANVGDFPVFKVKHWARAPIPETAALPNEEEAGQLIDSLEHAVAGATAYSLMKMRVPGMFDLVVIDEASQVRVAEAAIALSGQSPAGRVVIAGDHLQLPPIVRGEYPDPPPGEAPLHRSIFEVVRRDPRHDKEMTSQLLENFRMNDVLTAFPAGSLYGPRYRCASEPVAAARLPLQGRRTAPDDVVGFCLDPEFPLVLAVLENVFASRQNLVEAKLVARLVGALRKDLRAAGGRPYPDTAAGDAAFFADGVFVVSPHRAQIQAIRRELREIRRWKATPFVDTVDKMQGQEAAAVVVSYGVSDPEYALQEAEFIYELNRLNVAITRAKTKCVVCLPRPLLDGSPAVLDTEAAAAGLAFMRALQQRCAALGERRDFAADGDPTARWSVWRVGRA